jgi:hypothetical protein
MDPLDDACFIKRVDSEEVTAVSIQAADSQLALAVDYHAEIELVTGNAPTDKVTGGVWIRGPVHLRRTRIVS